MCRTQKIRGLLLLHDVLTLSPYSIDSRIPPNTILKSLVDFPTMQSKCNLITSSVLRGFQMLLAVVVLGLSVTLIKDHNNHNRISGFSSAPVILPLGVAIGAVTLVTAVFSLTVAWTNFVHEYIEMLVDVVIIMANVVGGMVCLMEITMNDQLIRLRQIIAIKLKGKNCSDASDKNRFGSGDYPYTGALGNIDILNGGCGKFQVEWYCSNTSDENRRERMNVRYKQSQADSVFMFLTAVLLFATITLTYLRMRRSF